MKTWIRVLFDCFFSRLALLFVGVFILLSAGASSGFLPASPHQAAAVTIQPTSGPPGTEVLISTTGFLTGTTGEVRWDGVPKQSFVINTSSFTRTFKVPSASKPGNHTITVCGNCNGAEFVDMVSSIFVVVLPQTSTPTKTPKPPTATFTLKPLLPAPVTLLPLLTDTPTPTLPHKEEPTACEHLGREAGAIVIDFDDYPEEQILDTDLLSTWGLSFDASVQVFDPSVIDPRSIRKAARSRDVGEFGSTELPIRMHFDTGLKAVGMFVGLESAPESRSPVTARLEVYGYRDGESGLVRLGEDTFEFPTTSEDIRHCLLFQAGDTEVITSASLEYVYNDGISAMEHRVMDDLIIDFTDLEMPSNQLPMVEIQTPTDLQVITGGDVTFTGEIREDRSLLQVRYQIKSQTGEGDWIIHEEGGLGTSVISDDSTLYTTLYTFPAESVFPAPGNYTLTITARDSNGEYGEDSVEVIYSPPSIIDIRFVNIEVTQAVQCMNNPECGSNTVPLIQNKPTLVRVYLSASQGPIPNISGHLKIYHEGSDGFQVVFPRAPVTVENVADPVSAFRGDLSRTLNFYIPPNLIRNPGSLRFEVVINSEHVPEECCYENNVQRLSEIHIHPSESLHVVFIPVAINGTVGDLGDLWDVVDGLYRMFPTYDIHAYLTNHGNPVYVYDIPGFDTGCGSFWSHTLASLWGINLFTIDPEDYTRYFGITAMHPSSFVGCGKNPGDEAAGDSAISVIRTGLIGAHEIAHNHDLDHAPCPASPPANVDPYYPVASGNLDEFGVDVVRNILYIPAANYDLMSYCGGETTTWISRYTYMGLMGAIGEVAGVPVKMADHPQIVNPRREGVYFTAAGLIKPNSVTLNTGFFQYHSAEELSDEMPDGPYSVEMQDAQGGIVFTRSFGPVVMSPTLLGGTSGKRDWNPLEGAIQLVLPWMDGIDQIIFRHDGVEIGRYSSGGRTPTIQVIAPNGGEVWGASGKRTIEWRAEDADGTPLQVIVQYSIDSGKTWTAIPIEGSGNRVSVDTAYLSGGDNALVRVIVSDGWNTTADISDSAFRIQPKAPEAHISNPEDGGHYPVGEPLFLLGFATDLEDGPIGNPESFQWSSNRDGELGTGDQLIAESLSAGKHTIKLKAIDSSGRIGTHQVTIIVGTDVGLTEGQRKLTLIAILGFLILLIAFVVLITGWLIVRRRTR